MNKVVVAVFFISLLSGAFKCASQETNKEKIFYAGFFPVSNYAMGKNLRFVGGLQFKRNSFYLGIGTHLNVVPNTYSNDNSVARNNGYANHFSERIHINAGFEYCFFKERVVRPFFYVDFLGGSISLINKDYFPYDKDSLGNEYKYTLYSPGPELSTARFLQLTIGAGLTVSLNSRLRLQSRIGVSEAFVHYRYGYRYGYVNEQIIEHLVDNYSVGISYLFK